MTDEDVSTVTIRELENRVEALESGLQEVRTLAEANDGEIHVINARLDELEEDVVQIQHDISAINDEDSLAGIVKGLHGLIETLEERVTILERLDELESVDEEDLVTTDEMREKLELGDEDEEFVHPCAPSYEAGEKSGQRVEVTTPHRRTRRLNMRGGTLGVYADDEFVGEISADSLVALAQMTEK